MPKIAAIVYSAATEPFFPKNCERFWYSEGGAVRSDLFIAKCDKHQLMAADGLCFASAEMPKFVPFSRNKQIAIFAVAIACIVVGSYFCLICIGPGIR